MTGSLVTVGDINVSYVEGGTPGRLPVVMIHGLAEDNRTWEPQFDSLADFHLFAYDLRGHGGTSVGKADGTLAQLAEDLCGFLETVTGPAICVGFSLGGTVVLAAAAARPDLMIRAVVLGTSSVVGRAARSFYADRIARACSDDRRQLRGALHEDTVAALYLSGPYIDTITDRRVEAIGDGVGYANAARAMAALGDEPLTPRLSAIRCHVTVIGAEHDAFCPRKAADIILANLTDADHMEIPAAGHLMNIDDPAAVSAAIATALKGAN